MKKSQFFAVSQFITDYPDGMSFYDLLDAVATGDESITRWEMVESWDDFELAEAIEMCEKAFSRAVADLLNESEPTDALNPYFSEVSQQLQDLSIFF